MQIISDIPDILSELCVATIGFFDGVHAGHRFLIEQVKEVAAARGMRSALITFPETQIIRNGPGKQHCFLKPGSITASCLILLRRFHNLPPENS